MSQSRFFIRLHGPSAQTLFARLETEFEEDGLPLAIVQLDEAAALHEVSIYVDEDSASIRNRISKVLASIPNLENQPIDEEILPDIDWVAHSLEGLKAVRAGRFIIHGAHERGIEQPGEIPIEIDAGQAFGTGHHGTTAGCLEMIDDIIAAESPGNALDLGTGSAVLAIAVAKLAGIPVLATDIDPVAIEVAQANIQLNQAGSWVEAITAAGFDHPVLMDKKPFDLIIANILARPLIELAPAIAAHSAEGGSLILSGLLISQHDKVVTAYLEQGFDHVKTFERGEWATVSMRYRGLRRYRG